MVGCTTGDEGCHTSVSRDMARQSKIVVRHKVVIVVTGLSPDRFMTYGVPIEGRRTPSRYGGEVVHA